MQITAPIVLKLGGSLLTLPDLFDRLHAVVELLNTDRLLIVPGGGAAANEVRRLDDHFQLSAEKAHWAAVAAMSLNAAMLARLSGLLAMVTSRSEAAGVWASGRVPILDAVSFLRSEDQCTDVVPLPASWDVTSDSIAAWVAVRWPASHLVIAKSCDMDGLSVRELVAHERLDAWFARVNNEPPAYWLNLTRSPLALTPLASEPNPG